MASVDNEIVLFDGTSGTQSKSATETGILKAASGVLSVAASQVDYAPAFGWDPLTTMRLLDDFMSGSGTSGELGALGWTGAGGTFVALGLTAAADHPGYLRKTTSTTPATVSRMGLRIGDAHPTFLPAEDFDLTWVFRANNFDSETQIQLGLQGDWSSIAPTNGIYFQKKFADTEWFGTCRATTETRTTAFAAADANWHRCRIRRKDASTISFSYDGGAEKDVTATIPTAAVQPGMLISNSSTNDRTVDIDLFVMTITGLSR